MPGSGGRRSTPAQGLLVLTLLGSVAADPCWLRCCCPRPACRPSGSGTARWRSGWGRRGRGSIAFTQVPASPYRITALVIAFLTAVLLWRLYFHIAGQLVDNAVLAASHPAHTGRIAGVAHLVMILGVITTSVGDDLVEKHPGTHTPLTWSSVILAGPAIIPVGRSVLEYVVYARVSLPRPAGIAALVALIAPLTLVPPLAVSGTAAIVLLLIAAADTRRSHRHPDEQPTPPGKGS